LTEHGKEMVELPLDPVYSHLLLLSLEEKYNCSDEILSIISILSTENFFYVPKDEKNNLSKVLLKFKFPNSDMLTKLNMFNKYLLSKNKKDFCKENFINKKSIKRALLIRQQLAEYLDSIKHRRKTGEDMVIKKVKKEEAAKNIYSYVPKADFDWQKVSRCLAAGLTIKTAKLNANGNYTLVIYFFKFVDFY